MFISYSATMSFYHENVPQYCCGVALWNRAKIQINKMAALNDPNFDFFLIVFRLDS